MTAVIRHRLIYILLLGVVTSALSLAALVRALSLSEAQRLERAREAVGGELDRLIALTPSAEALTAAPHTSYVGLRGGWLKGPDDIAEGLPAAWVGPVRHAVEQSAAAMRAGRAARTVIHEPLDSGQVVIACAPAAGGRFAWTGVLLLPSSYLRPWRLIAAAIAIATALLFATSLATVLAFRRDLLSSRGAAERLSQELRQKERLAALGRVAAGVAHEVRNPLAAIKLRLDLTAAGHELPAATRQAITSASSEIARLDRLVSDLLIVAGKQPAPRRIVELGALVRARAEQLAPWAEARGVALVTEGDAATEADPESLSRAIDNLLRNAIEASPRGEAVIARVEASANEIDLSVEDAGAGVDPAREAELFEPFFTTKPDGTGLGLALSLAIARAHGGEVTYARPAGRTCFRMSLRRGAQAAS